MTVAHRIFCLAAVVALFVFPPCPSLAVSRELQQTPAASADEKPKTSDAQATDAKSDDDAQAARFARFREQLSGARLVGQFTVVGREDRPLAKEEYVISSVEKTSRGDYWLFKAQIKYGKNNVTVPMPLEVKWAGDTPVITLAETTIIGLGTFSARVVIDGDRYAGTWQHGETGGHLFGRIEKIASEKPDESNQQGAAENSAAPATEAPDEATGEKVAEPEK